MQGKRNEREWSGMCKGLRKGGEGEVNAVGHSAIIRALDFASEPGSQT
jgi:hypothetical protein